MFTAVYSEADLRPSDNASGLSTYDGEKYNIGWILFDFPTDYVNSSGNLISELGRIEQLHEFFVSE